MFFLKSATFDIKIMLVLVYIWPLAWKFAKGGYLHKTDFSSDLFMFMQLCLPSTNLLASKSWWRVKAWHVSSFWRDGWWIWWRLRWVTCKIHFVVRPTRADFLRQDLKAYLKLPVDFSERKKKHKHYVHLI